MSEIQDKEEVGTEGFQSSVRDNEQTVVGSSIYKDLVAPENTNSQSTEAPSKEELAAEIYTSTREEQLKTIEENEKKNTAKNAEIDKRKALAHAYDEALKVIEDGIPKPLSNAFTVTEKINDIETNYSININSYLDLDELNHYIPKWKVSIVSDDEKKEYLFSTDVNRVVLERNIISSTIINGIINYINNDNIKNAVASNKAIYDTHNTALDALSYYDHCNYKGFENVPIYGKYSFNLGEHLEPYMAYRIKVVKDDEGNEHEVRDKIGSIASVVERFNLNGDENVTYTVRFYTRTGKIKDINLTQAEIDTHDGMTKLRRAGCHIPMKTEKEFLEMLQTNLAYGSKKHKISKDDVVGYIPLPVLESVDTMGWFGDSYVCGTQCFGPTKYYCQNEKLRKEYHVSGFLDGYMEGIKGMVNIPELRLMMALAITAIILSKAGISSFNVSINGMSSNIKTTRCKLGLSLFGSPNLIVMTFNASNQAPNKYIEIHQDTMTVLDEVKGERDTLKAADIAKAVSANQSRFRYNKDTDENDSMPVSTITIYTSEDDLFDAATADGTMARFLSIHVSDLRGRKDIVEAFEKYVAPTNNKDKSPKNYGLLAEPIFKSIFLHMKHGDLTEFKEEVTSEWRRRYGAPEKGTAARVSDMQVASVMGFLILEEVFDGLRDEYPWLEKMDAYEVVHELTDEHLQEVSRPQWQERLSLLLSECDQHQLYFDLPEPTEDGRPLRTYKIHGYHGTYKEEPVLYIPVAEVEGFCNDHKYNYSTFKRDLRDNNIIAVGMKKPDKNGKVIPDGYYVKAPKSITGATGSECFAIKLKRVNEIFPYSDTDKEIALDAMRKKNKESKKLVESEIERKENVRKANEKVDAYMKYYEHHMGEKPFAYTDGVIHEVENNKDGFNQWCESQGLEVRI